MLLCIRFMYSLSQLTCMLILYIKPFQCILFIYFSTGIVNGCDVHRLKDNLQRYFSFPRYSEEQKLQPSLIIEETLVKCGFLLNEQSLKSYTGQSGKNIIGVLPGYLHSTKHDTPVIVVAHLDTIQRTGGMSDNGSGLAALLELAYMFHERSSFCSHANSIILVALDFSEAAFFGSSKFVNEWLGDHSISITNVVVLDSLLNFDPFPTSQGIPKQFETLFPEAFQQIDSHSYMGDFIQVTARDKIDDYVVETFTKAFINTNAENKWAQQAGVWTLPVKVPANGTDDAKSLQNFKFQMNGDHRSFWIPKDKSLNISCVMISDSGQYRGQLQYCHRSYCDGLNLLTKENLKYLEITVDTIFLTIEKLVSFICISNEN